MQLVQFKVFEKNAQRNCWTLYGVKNGVSLKRWKSNTAPEQL